MGHLDTNPVYHWTPADHRVSELMESYFANFIKTGDPNGDDLLHWPANHPGTAVQVMHLNVTPHVEPETDRPRYLFLDATATTRPH